MQTLILSILNRFLGLVQVNVVETTESIVYDIPDSTGANQLTIFVSKSEPDIDELPTELEASTNEATADDLKAAFLLLEGDKQVKVPEFTEEVILFRHPLSVDSYIDLKLTVEGLQETLPNQVSDYLTVR